MRRQWRLFMAALRFATDPDADAADAAPQAAMRFLPLAGIVIGLVSAAVYWLAAQAWPTSVAVVLSMLATVACTSAPADGRRSPSLTQMLLLLAKYNALMGLSSAQTPLALPEFLTLGWIMIAGHAASRALVVSLMAMRSPGAAHIGSADLAVALLAGLAPAVGLGIPGLIGLAVAIALRLGGSGPGATRLRFAANLDLVQQVTETGFYLGALATWRFV